MIGRYGFILMVALAMSFSAGAAHPNPNQRPDRRVALGPASTPAHSPADQTRFIVPTTPAPIEEVILAQRFEVQEPFPYRWSAEGIEVDEGWLLVLVADPALIRPREIGEPVLFVGERPAQRLSRGGRSGRMVVIVPLTSDLSNAPLFFGTPGLPEAIGYREAMKELSLAQSSGIVLEHHQAITRAVERGTEAMTFADYDALLSHAYGLIQEHVLAYDGETADSDRR